MGGGACLTALRLYSFNMNDCHQITLPLNARGGISIPVAICREWGLKPGQAVEIDVKPTVGAETTPVQKETLEEITARIRGAIGRGNDAMGNMTTMEYLDWLRGPVELPPSPR